MPGWLLKLGLFWLLVAAVFALALAAGGSRQVHVKQAKPVAHVAPVEEERPPPSKSDRVTARTVPYVPQADASASATVAAATVAARFAEIAAPPPSVAPSAAPLPRARPPAQDELQDEPAPRPRRVRSGDLCARHGLRKVITRGGRSWRCRR